jgi:hypothetical protein
VIVQLVPNSQQSLASYLGASTWASLPVTRLNADYKVMTIDDVSPLAEDFSEKAYPLRGIYALYTAPAVVEWLGEQGLKDLQCF